MLFSCDSKQKSPNYIEIRPEFASYIAAHTSGLVSRQSPVQIVLQNHLDSLALQDKLPKNLLKFQPAIKGEMSVVNGNTLHFVPSEPLKPGVVYTGTLALDKLEKDVDKDLSTFQFQFQTKKQDFSVHIEGFDSESENDGSLSLKGSLITNDISDAAKVEQMLNASLGGKSLPVRWNHASNGQQHQFTVTGIEKKAAAQQLELEWNGKGIEVNRDHKNQINLPAENSFDITHVSVLPQSEQVININFSHPLDKEKFLDGLVEIVPVNVDEEEEYYYEDEAEKVYVKSVVAQGNNLRVYPTKALGGEVKLVVHPGVRSSTGEAIAHTKTVNLTLSHLLPSVKFVGSGNIVPNSENVLLPFEAVGLRAVRVEVTRIYERNMHQFFQRNQYNQSNDLRMVGKKIYRKVISLDDQPNYNPKESKVYELELSQIVKHEPGAIYNIEFSFDKDFAISPCGEAQPETWLAPVEKDALAYTSYEASDDAIDGYEYYNMYPPDYNWQERNNPCDVSYYTSEKFVSRNVLASNLGVIVKSGNTPYSHFAVTNLTTAKPESGVKITAYDLQNQEVGSTVTGYEGFAVMDLTAKAFLIKAEKGNQKAYVRVDDGSALSVSTFDVSGESVQGNMAGFLYGERGVWRPGDSIHLTFVLNKKWVKTPTNQPAILELKNPDGQVMHREVNNKPVGGFYAFHLTTPVAAQTGNWLANVSVGGLNYQKTLKIETIKPNRLKINTRFDSQILSPQSSNRIDLSAEWLTGATARNLGASMVATVHAIPTKFSGYENFVFDDKTRQFEATEQLIFDGSLNQEGRAIVDAKLVEEFQPPGMLQLGVFTKVFEPGGDFSSKYDLVKYSPYSNYVGLNFAFEYENSPSLSTNKNHSISVASVSPTGQPTSAQATVKIYKLKRSWWYNADASDLAYYVSGSYENLYKEEHIEITGGAASFQLKIPDRDWGNYYVQICDNSSGHCAGQKLWMDWPYWRTSEDVSDESASIFQFTTDKSKYRVGEIASIDLPHTIEVKALVSIENGIGVLQQIWATPEKDGNKIQVKITEEMAPNAYVYVSLMQPHGKQENDLPIRIYGLASIQVENPELQIQPKIESPQEIKPNSQYSISVSEENAKAMTYTLAIVDEGLLDVTNFKTPDIHTYFNRKQALGVKTWDIYNYVLGAYGGKVESVFAIGGDMALQAQNREKINRFEPVVRYLGPFQLKAGEKATHQLQMENYVGSVKVMVVAGNENGAYGSAEKAISVKQSLMTLATLPRMLNPGDELDLPVTVFAMDPSIRNVEIEVQTSDLISVENKTNVLQFTETGDKTSNFKLKIPEKTGVANVKIIARSGANIAQDEVDIEIRYPNPPITEVKEYNLTSGNLWNTTYTPVGLPGTQTTVLQLSALPPMRLEQRLNFLIQYPHGCLEQITSGLFAQLYLPHFTNLSEQQQNEIQSNIHAGLNRIKQHQLAGGGLTYWPGLQGSDTWSSTYALHFVLQAEQMGYQIPVGLKAGLINFTAREAKQWNYYNDVAHYSDLQQAYRLFTLALSANPEISLMNRFREKTKNSTAQWLLIAAYAKAGQGEIARNLAENASKTVADYRSEPFTFGSSLRDYSIILLAQSAIKDETNASILMRQIAEDLNKNTWHSTQTLGFALLSIADFIGLKNQSQNQGIQAEININGQKQTHTSQYPIATFYLPNNSGNVQVKNMKNSYLFAQIISTGIPMYYTNGAGSNTLKLSVDFYDLNNQPIDFTNLKQGTDFKAVTTITHPGYLADYHELALTHMFPTGWEIINTRYQDNDHVTVPYSIDYQDYRDDRVNSYFDLKQGSTIEITTLLNATYAGDFHMPAVFCEAMYDNSISAVIPSKKAKVYP
ncbi:MAG: MG2 domain-containing protein [Weeksellaceae bacterium]|nr:MG2 domain-containing protein [Weeksellaceae bacterium]